MTWLFILQTFLPKQTFHSNFQATSCSCRAATEPQPLTTLGCWAPICPRPKAPVWNSGPTDSHHVKKPFATWYIPQWHLMWWYFNTFFVKCVQLTASWRCGGCLKVNSTSCWWWETWRNPGGALTSTSHLLRNTRSESYTLYNHKVNVFKLIHNYIFFIKAYLTRLMPSSCYHLVFIVYRSCWKESKAHQASLPWMILNILSESTALKQSKIQ